MKESLISGNRKQEIKRMHLERSWGQEVWLVILGLHGTEKRLQMVKKRNKTVYAGGLGDIDKLFDLGEVSF